MAVGAGVSTAAVRRSRWTRYVPAVPAALTVLAAGAAFQRVFTWGDVAVPLVVSVVVGALAGAGGRRALSAAGGVVLAVVAVVVGALVSSALTAAAFASPRVAFGTAISRGIGSFAGAWSRILTTSVPAPPTADRLPLAAGLVALAAGWAVVAATRRHPGVDALAPAALVLVIALLLGVGGPGSLAVVAGPPLALAAVYLLMVSRPGGEGVVWVPPARVLAAVVTAAVVLVFSLGVGDHLPFARVRQPVNLRNLVSPPVDLSNVANPLDEVPGWQRERGTVMFTASVDQAWLRAPSDWNLVALDRYDGTGWSSDTSATRAGQVLALPSGVSGALLGPVVRVVVHLRSLAGPWIPTVGVPTGVTPADLDYDPATSNLLYPGSTPDVLSLSGRLAQPTLAALDRAGISSSPTAAALTAVPSCFPATLRTLASRAVTGLDRPDQEAAAIEQELASSGGFRLDAAATEGTNCARLTSLVATHTGTAEQFAAAFALMARSVGLPSRLVVGFTPGTVDPATRQTTVTASDVTVWPEVDLGGLGWVTFDPSPSKSGRATNGPGTGTTTTVPAAEQGLDQVRQSVASQRSHPAASIPPVTTPAVGHQGSSGSSPVIWLLVALAAIAVVLLGTATARVVARRRRRARRRAAADPTRKLLGAWAEVVDSLAPFGRPLPLASLTPSEICEEAERVVAATREPSRQLAALVDQAVYAGVADDELAAQAWACSDVTVRALDQAVPPRHRIGALLLGRGALAPRALGRGALGRGGRGPGPRPPVSRPGPSGSGSARRERTPAER